MLRCYNFRFLLSGWEVGELRCLSTSLYVLLQLDQKVSHNYVVLLINIDCFIVEIVVLIAKNTLLSMEHLAHPVALIIVASMNEYVQRSELLSNIFENPFIYAFSALLLLFVFIRSTFCHLVSFIFFICRSCSCGGLCLLHGRDFIFLIFFRLGFI